jgi:ADP-ribosylglycohydrolase
MALGIAEVLASHGEIDQDYLATVFARRHNRDPYRGYGSGAHEVLAAIHSGTPWRTAAQQLFDGQGSLGNGAAMRVAPLGAYFADDLEVVESEARKSAEVTHSHPEGIAGGIAVAVAAAWAAWQIDRDAAQTAGEMFSTVLELTPRGETWSGIERAAGIPLESWQYHAAELLGNGSRITAADTVPFCLWLAARHLDDYTEALWSIVHVGGDIDTNAAIVGGILALAVGREGLPSGWLQHREPLYLHSADG